MYGVAALGLLYQFVTHANGAAPRYKHRIGVLRQTSRRIQSVERRDISRSFQYWSLGHPVCYVHHVQTKNVHPDAGLLRSHISLRWRAVQCRPGVARRTRHTKIVALIDVQNDGIVLHRKRGHVVRASGVHEIWKR